jgi:superfamily II DNA or RNA helicase
MTDLHVANTKSSQKVASSTMMEQKKHFFSSYATINPEPLDLVQPVNKTPRYYQTNAVRSCAEYLTHGFRRILYVQPTGTGKTLLSVLTALSVDVRKALNIYGLNRKIRVLFIASQAKLLRQAIHEFSFCEDIELIAHSAFKDVPDEVVEQGWDMTFIDEAHHEAMTSIQRLLDAVGDKPVFGLTATPDRGDGLLLKFERYIYPITKTEAIRRKFISAPAVNSIIDAGGTNKLVIAKEIVSRHYDEFGQTIVYFKTQKECRDFVEFCTEKGYSAIHLTGDNNMDELLDAFTAKEFRMLVNCQKLGEGVDILGCTDVLLARQFRSKGEKEQYIGRAIRPDSECNVWEFVNPLTENILTKTLFPVVRFHRLIFFRSGQWHDSMIEVNDDSIYDNEYLESNT